MNENDFQEGNPILQYISAQDNTVFKMSLGDTYLWNTIKVSQYNYNLWKYKV